MSYSSTYNQTTTFTVTHARYLASKVAADLKRIQRLYNGTPSDKTIQDYEDELVEFLRKGFVTEVTYGFQKDDKWIEPTLIYTAKEIATGTDDDPGKVRPGANVFGAHFTSYMVTNAAYKNQTADERIKFDSGLPFKRAGAPAPGINGYVSSDKSYYSGGKGLDRSSVKSL